MTPAVRRAVLGAAFTVVTALAAVLAPPAGADIGLGASFSYLSAAATSTCSGTVTATDTWQSSGAGAAPHSISLDGARAHSLASTAGHGTDRVVFANVPVGRHVVVFASQDGNVRVTVVVCPTTLTAGPSLTPHRGSVAVASATLRNATTHRPVAGVRVSVLQRSGARWRTVAVTSTDAHGVARWAFRAGGSTQLLWSFAGTRAAAGSSSHVQYVSVR